MDDFGNKDALDDLEVEIIDLDPNREGNRISILWLYGQHLRSQARLWMSLLTVVGVIFLAVMLLSPLLTQLPRPLENAPGKLTTSASLQANSCISIVMVLAPNNVTVLNDTVQRTYAKVVWGVPLVGVSCTSGQILPTGNNATHRRTQK